MAGEAWALEAGSSPLTRGKHVDDTPVGGTDGLIPAHAGKTGSRVRSGRWRPAHPRSRGENLARLTDIENVAGSSPLTRGKQQQRGRDNLDARLIPAHAGKTSRRRCRRSPDGAHPRSRGENLGERTYNAIKAGSSPLTRGKPRPSANGTRTMGLIPAHAGKTSRRRCRRSPDGAHPRSRGENVGLLKGDQIQAGSSPLTRGKRRVTIRMSCSSGLIPAHAGKTRRTAEAR